MQIIYPESYGNLKLIQEPKGLPLNTNFSAMDKHKCLRRWPVTNFDRSKSGKCLSQNSNFRQRLNQTLYSEGFICLELLFTKFSMHKLEKLSLAVLETLCLPRYGISLSSVKQSPRVPDVPSEFCDSDFPLGTSMTSQIFILPLWTKIYKFLSR